MSLGNNELTVVTFGCLYFYCILFDASDDGLIRIHQNKTQFPEYESIVHYEGFYFIAQY